MTTTGNTKYDELVSKLKEIFQIDKPELDFGIYRILHVRQREITDFLEHHFAKKVKEVLAGNAAGEEATIERELNEAVAQAKGLGIDPDASPKVKELKAKLAEMGGGEQSEGEVYSHLLNFFSRYYEDGDFVSKRRFKGNDTYAIPYSGEEVKLYWANADQYYTKTGEAFTNYAFTLEGGAKVHFSLVTAETAKDNIKDNDFVRCFVLWNPDNTPEDIGEEETDKYPQDFIEEKDGELFIHFQYLKFKKGTKQKVFLDEAKTKVQERLPSFPEFAALESPAPVDNDKEKKRTLLQKHLERYAAKNTSDYFIHKDLGGFLRRELDFYIENEMMHLDDIAKATAFRQIEADLRKIQTVRVIALKLIDFMAQLENFQKKLWLKKKFVVQCDWCMTLDIVRAHAPELMGDIFANEKQKEEWRKLGLPDGDLAAKGAEGDGRAVGTSLPGLDDGRDGSTSRPPLDARMVDTKFFSEAFKAKLLASIDNLDERTDGVLVHSENFQALRLMQERYKGQVKCIYIDPPYNTGNDGFIYKDGYSHSSWITMVENRLVQAKSDMPEDGVIFISIDDNEVSNLKRICDEVFGKDNFVGQWNWFKSATPPNLSKKIKKNIEYVLCYEKLKSNSKYVGRRKGSKSSNGLMNQTNSYHELLFPEGAVETGLPDGVYKAGQYGTSSYDIKLLEDAIVAQGRFSSKVHLAGKFKWNQKKLEQELANGTTISIQTESFSPSYEKQEYDPEVPPNFIDKTVMVSTTEQAGDDLDAMFGVMKVFDYPKPVSLIAYLASFISSPNDTILDYFAGSGTTGHAVIDLNRQDMEKGIDAKRKYILVEMGEHFDTVLKPRIEKVVFSPNWKDGKPECMDKGVSHCFKYLTLESYEDTLNNLKLKDVGGQLDGILKEEFLIKYMLDMEARGSIIDTESFRHPFKYELKVAVDSSGATQPRKVDLVETFNWLIGIRVTEVRRRIDQEVVIATIVTGMLPGEEKESLIIWRDVDKMDNASLLAYLKSQDYISKKDGRPLKDWSAIYVNGDHAIPNRKLGDDEDAPVLNIRQIENVFLEKMFEEA